MDDVIFLNMDLVLDIHRRQLEAFGGQDGFLDRGIVESAIAQPKQSMFGEYLHTDIAHMAAAYLFHIATTQGFLDGNKRTALVCAETFLELNGYIIDVPNADMYELTLGVATNQINKDQLTDWIRDHIKATTDEDV